MTNAGEHGAICIYRAQRWLARWRAPEMIEDIEHFMSHEQRHRALFEAELGRRGIRRCRSFHLCGLALTGLAGARAISLTTEAVESVVLAHLSDQLGMLRHADPAAAAVVENIVSDEQEHHDSSARKLADASFVDGLLRPVVRGATEAVIWLGMRLP